MSSCTGRNRDVPLAHSFYCKRRPILVSIRTNRRLKLEQFCAIYKVLYSSKPRREKTRARSRPPPTEWGEASKVRHDKQTAQQVVDFISSWVVCGSKPGLKLTSRFLRRQVNLSVYSANIGTVGCQPILYRVLPRIQYKIANLARERCRALQATGSAAIYLDLSASTSCRCPCQDERRSVSMTGLD